MPVPTRLAVAGASRPERRETSNGVRRLALMMVALLFAVIAQSAPANAATTVGSSFNDRLLPNQQIANNGNRLVMQSDGNLVLYANTGRVCWASGTNGLSGVYAKYSGDWRIDSPWMSLESPYGQLRKWRGGYTWTKKTGNVSINARGEVWIAYKLFVRC
jgi:hypothetical protein